MANSTEGLIATITSLLRSIPQSMRDEEIQNILRSNFESEQLQMLYVSLDFIANQQSVRGEFKVPKHPQKRSSTAIKQDIIQDRTLNPLAWQAWVESHLPSMYTEDEVYWIRIYRSKQCDDCQGGDDVTEAACAESSDRYILTGKWMIFPKSENLDGAWLTVAHALHTGQLGDSCKVNAKKEGSNVIIVYTPNFRDEKEVLRVGLALLDLFPYLEQISYKPDVFTLSDDGIYGGNTLPRTLYNLRRDRPRLLVTKGRGGESALAIAERLVNEAQESNE